MASLAEFNLQNGSSTLNAGGRPGSGGGPYLPDKLSAACSSAAAAPGALRIPRVVGTETLLATRCKRSYANAHTYHINSIALSSDCETFISADDLRVNLWHLDRWEVGGSCRRAGRQGGAAYMLGKCLACGRIGSISGRQYRMMSTELHAWPQPDLAGMHSFVQPC